MYFKRIDLHGFKSFAEPVSIDFHEGITCIVGPNGSGKSNISDAIRWVLGEQSPKMLRGGKMEEVIFAGTANRKSRGMAEVTLTIDNSKNILPIDYAEVAITRRMYRSGESEYAINNNQCRLRDIRELIMDTGIGVDGYSIIGQGKISEIVSNKPESRREIFEEAAGIVKYRTKKAESERKLDAANGNLDRVNDIVSEIEDRIQGLKEDSIKATEYLSLREKYKALEINITLKNIENVELKNEFLKDDLQETEGSLQSLKEEKAHIDQEVSQQRSRNEELEGVSNDVRDRLLKNSSEISELKNRNQLNQEKLQTIEKDTYRLQQEIKATEEKLDKEKSGSQEIFSKKESIEKKVQELEADLNEKLSEFMDLTGILTNHTEEIDNYKNSLFQLHALISNKKSEMSSLENLQNNLKRTEERILGELEKHDTTGQELSLAFTAGSGEKIKNLESINSLKQSLQADMVKQSEALENERTTAKELEQTTLTAGQLSARKKTMEEMESNYEGYNNAVKFIMKSSLNGIDGVVAELIEVPTGFEVAIETALGAALQNIVCADDQSAKAAVNHLKVNKAGRLTFLPVESIKGNKIAPVDVIKNAQGFKGYGAECIKFQEKYKNVMEYLLGRVLIVDSLDHAIALSKKVPTGGFRVVTLEGEVINSGGAITGGTYRNNTANLLERKAEISKIENRLQELQRHKITLEKRLETVRALLHQTTGSIKDTEAKYREAELKQINLENQLSLLNNQRSEVEHNVKRGREELDHIAQETHTSTEMIDAIVEEIRKAEADIQSVERNTEEKLVSFDTFKAQSEEINEQITKVRIAVSTAENERNHLHSLTERIEAYIGELTSEITEKKRLIAGLEEENRNILSGDLDLSEEILVKEEEKVSLERYLAEITEEKSELVKTLNKNLQEKDSFDEKMNQLLNQKYDMDIKLAKNETQLENFKNKLWDEFEISYIQAIEFKNKNFNFPVALKEIKEIKSRIKELGEVNVGAIKEYETVNERYEFLTTQRADLLSAIDALKVIIQDMDKTIKENFKESFDKIVVNFEDAFRQMFGGGTAELRLEDESRPLESGIEIVAQPPGKKLQNINLMSGGEKTMTAIALMFAVLKAKPTPFCILDEIEAALDDANIDRFARYLTNFNNVQFALVTHQKATMEYADVLYGVTMPEEGISKVISLKLGDEIGA